MTKAKFFKESYKALNLFASLALVLNMSFVGVFFVAEEDVLAQELQCYTDADCATGEVCMTGLCELDPTLDSDDDGDGVPNHQDICPGGDDNVDVDGDGVPDDCDDCVDEDDDGYGLGLSCIDTDCNDTNPDSWRVDFYYYDGDDDGWYGDGDNRRDDGMMAICYGSEIPVGYTETSLGEDCDDTDDAVNPDASEICDDGIDNDCDGDIDEFDSDCESGGNVPNPSLNSSCGTDMVLVIDSSSSMYGTPLQQEKDAFKDFIDAFLPQTPTQIAIVDFNTTATLVQGFTSDVTALKAAIDSVSTTPNSGSDIRFTNWHDALVDAHLEFGNGRDTAPDLLVFSSDGNPNHWADGSGGYDKAEALSQAISEANSIKTDGIRIIALGIMQDDLTPTEVTTFTDNLISISGSVVAPPATVDRDADVILTDFNSLAGDLADYADELCGGTVTVKKYLNDVLDAGWDFSALIDDTSPALTGTTDNQGMYNFDIDTGNEIKNVDISEVLQSGYILDAAACYTDYPDNLNEVGVFDGTDTVSGLQVGKSDVVTCEFYNIDEPTCDYSIDGHKYNSFALMYMPDWEIQLKDVSGEVIATTSTDSSGYYEFTGLCEGDYEVHEVMQSGWTQVVPDVSGLEFDDDGMYYYDFSLPSEVTEFDFYNKPMICAYKYNYSSDAPIENWEITLTGAAQGCDGQCSGVWAVATTTDENGEVCFGVGSTEYDFALIEETRTDWIPMGPTSVPFQFDGTQPYFYSFYNDYDPGDSCEPTTEVCDGVDNDCDDLIDEDLNCGDSCEPTTEVCDNEDNDCDGLIDEDLNCGGGGGEIYGCTDETAVNYNSNATDDNGSCLYCGNGDIDDNEECDDGNTQNGDGCNASCRKENSSGGGTPPYSGGGAFGAPVVLGEEGAPVLEVTKVANKELVNPGDEIEFEITVKNVGNLTAFNVKVQDVLPEGLEFVDLTGEEYTFGFGDLEPNSEKSVTVKTRVKDDAEAKQYINNVTVTSDNHPEMEASDDVMIEEVKVLAETGFSVIELMLLLFVLSLSIASSTYLRRLA